jgi:hypothetical protein
MDQAFASSSEIKATPVGKGGIKSGFDPEPHQIHIILAPGSIIRDRIRPTALATGTYLKFDVKILFKTGRFEADINLLYLRYPVPYQYRHLIISS